jgi:CheY-like chemotaxis protein
MPELAGEEMARRFRAARPNLKVLYVSGVVDRMLDERALWEGEAYLRKPFSSAGLREAVALLLFGTLKRVR